MTTPPFLKFSLYLLLICSVTACSKGGVKLELKNKEVNFSNLPEKGVFEGDDQRRSSRNIISYSLTNTTNKKLLFLFDPREIQPSFGISPTTENFGYMGFTIKDTKDSVVKFYPRLPMWASRSDLSGCELYYLEKKTDMYAILGVKPDDVRVVDKFVNHSLIIYPGESKTFQAILNLPLMQEIDYKLQRGSLYYPALDENHTFNFFYFCNARKLKNKLPKYLLEELNANEIEIFDGELVAPAVKLKKKP